MKLRKHKYLFNTILPAHVTHIKGDMFAVRDEQNNLPRYNLVLLVMDYEGEDTKEFKPYLLVSEDKTLQKIEAIKCLNFKDNASTYQVTATVSLPEKAEVNENVILTPALVSFDASHVIVLKKEQVSTEIVGEGILDKPRIYTVEDAVKMFVPRKVEPEPVPVPAPIVEKPKFKAVLLDNKKPVDQITGNSAEEVEEALAEKHRLSSSNLANTQFQLAICEAEEDDDKNIYYNIIKKYNVLVNDELNVDIEDETSN